VQDAGAGGGVDWGLIPTNTWRYYTLAVNYSLGKQYGYINGNFVIIGNISTLTHSSLQIARGGQTGSSQLSYYTYLKCQISQLSIYNKTLTAQEIKQNYNATKKRYGL
jgi:phosphoglycerate-specific signal transduction histidine kinase